MLDKAPVYFGRHRVCIFPDVTQLQRAAAGLVCQICQQARQANHGVNLALSGGSTPAGVYSSWITPEFQDQMPWSDLQVWFGDERYVPHDDSQSNCRMAHQAFLKQAPLRAEQIHPIPTQCPEAQDCAQQYEQQLRQVINGHRIPQLDCILLGMGDDGHTASLFPDTSLLDETERLVGASYVAKLNSWRVSFTLPLINQAHYVCVLVSGESKAEVLSQVLLEPQHDYPIQRVQPAGEMIWLVDEAAASRLPRLV